MDRGAARYFASAIHEFAAVDRQGELLPDRRDHRRPAVRVRDARRRPAWTPRSASPTSRTSWSGWSRATATRADYFDLFRNSFAGRQGLAHLVPRPRRHRVRRPRPGAQGHAQGPVRADDARPADGARARSRSTPPRSASPASTTAASSASTAPAATTGTSARRCSAARSARSAAAAGTSSTRTSRVYRELATHPRRAPGHAGAAAWPAVSAADLRRRVELRPARGRSAASCARSCPGRGSSPTARCCCAINTDPSCRAPPG